MNPDYGDHETINRPYWGKRMQRHLHHETNIDVSMAHPFSLISMAGP
jgi:hypothetical protein